VPELEEAPKRKPKPITWRGRLLSKAEFERLMEEDEGHVTRFSKCLYWADKETEFVRDYEKTMSVTDIYCQEDIRKARRNFEIIREKYLKAKKELDELVLYFSQESSANRAEAREKGKRLRKEVKKAHSQHTLARWCLEAYRLRRYEELVMERMKSAS